MIGLAVGDIYWLQQDFTPKTSYSEECLKREAPSFDKNQPLTVFDGSIASFRLCGLNIGKDYMVLLEDGYNVTFTAEIQAEIVIVQVNDVDRDGLVAVELRNETVILDTFLVAITQTGGIPPQVFMAIGIPLLMAFVTSFFLYRLWRFIKWVRRPI